MHYYKKNIGDYAKKAGRLSLLQHGVYNQLIDACYDRETFPTLEEAIDWVWASTSEEKEAVQFVLDKFFYLSDDGIYVQKRIDEEVEEYQVKCDTNKRIANEREKKRKEEKANGEQGEHEPCNETCADDNEPPPNHKPITNNHKPIKKTKAKKITLSQYLQNCKAENVQAVPEDDGVFKYCETMGIDSEMIAVSWHCLKLKYVEDQNNNGKTYVSWRQTLQNAVRENWFKLWWTDHDGGVSWTTTGQQRRKELEVAA